MPRKKISLCLIVKNEEKDLARCINSLKGCYDELIIADTGSTDKTVEIAKKLGARVEHFDWIDDFGAARNFSFSFATGDWIMWVDADDILQEGQAEDFRRIVHSYDDNPNVTSINFQYIYSHESTGTGEIPNFKYHRCRVIKKGTAKWVARIHEYLAIDQSKSINDHEIVFHHFRDEGKGTQNTARNLRILQKVVDGASVEEKPRYLFYYGKECMYNGLWDDAMKAFKEYIPLSSWLPEKHRAMYELGVCYNNLGDEENAKRYAFEAINLDKNYADPYILLGQMAYEKKDWQECIRWMSVVPTLEKPKTLFFDYIPYNTYVPWDYMSISYWNLGDMKRGWECLHQAMEYKPYDKRYLFNWTWFVKLPKVSIIIPTYKRTDRLVTCLEKIAENTIYSNYEVLIGVDGVKETYDFIKGLESEKVKITFFDKHRGVAHVVSDLVNMAESEYVCFIGDDVEVKPGWLIYAFSACEGKYLVGLNDGVWNGEIANHWFAPKALKESFGGDFFHKGYHHVGMDNELTDKAKKIGAYKFGEMARIDHIHFIAGNSSDKKRIAPKDETYAEAWTDEWVVKDRALLATRKKNNYLSDSKVLKVNVGAGHKQVPGFVTLDKYNDSDIRKDIFEFNLFNPETVDEFLVEHVLEHFNEQKGDEFLDILYKALKPGGVLEIAVPDMGKVQDVTDVDYRIKVMYGWQIDGMRHNFGFYKESFEKKLRDHGFLVPIIEEGWEYDAPSLRAKAIKSPVVDKNILSGILIFKDKE